MSIQRPNSLWLTFVAAGVVSVGGCAASESLDLSDASSSGAGGASIVGGSAGGAAGNGLASGAGGTTGAAGSAAVGGLGGTTGQAGADGNGTGAIGGSAGRAGVAGRSGAVVGAAGRSGNGGAAAGSNGQGGNGQGGNGQGGNGQGGNVGRGGSPDASEAPTFTEIYKTILIVYCSGSGCHDPGTSGGLGFATQASAFAALSHQVTPGDGVDSDLYVTLNTGVMPKGKPKLSASNIALIREWIDDGALDN
jgi:hypothetical protein